MKIVFILSDALRNDYIQYMPFLNKMSESHTYYKNVIPGVGFCEISEYVTGIESIKNGNLFQITFSGKYGKPQFRFASRINKISNYIPRVRRYTYQLFDKYLSRHERDFLHKDILKVRYNIPIDMLNYFRPTESRFEYDSEDFFPESNLFVQLRKSGKTYDIDDFVQHNKIKGTDEERLERLNNKIKNKKLADFTLLYIGKGEIAHMTGTTNVEFHKKLREYDNMLEKTKMLLDSSYKDDYCFIILGDHGMVDIEEYIDVRPLLKRLEGEVGLIVGEDYVYFIDSTAFRVWIKDSGKKDECNNIIYEYLKNDLDDLEINSSSYGDLIYVLQPGKVFFPDFFNTKRNKAMHGYTNLIEEQSGMCVVIGTNEQKIIENLELHETKDVVLDLIAMEKK